MSWIEIGLLIFILIICFIIAVLFFLALDSLGRSRAGIVDDEPTDNAYSWGTWATLSIVISIALIISTIILYYYELSGQTIVKVLLFVTLIALIMTGIFAIQSCNSMGGISNPDSEVDSARNLIFYGAILSFIVAFFVLIVFIISLFYTVTPEPEECGESKPEPLQCILAEQVYRVEPIYNQAEQIYMVESDVLVSEKPVDNEEVLETIVETNLNNKVKSLDKPEYIEDKVYVQRVDQ